MSLYSYSGAQPVIVKSENERLVLEIIKKQLEIVERITQEKWLVESGTKIRKEDSK